MSTPHPGVYRIDPSRSTITFRTRHLFGLGAVRGTFRLHEGEIRVADPPGESAVRATVDADSFHTGNPGRDRAVRSPRLLDTARHPAFTFISGGTSGGTSGGVTGPGAGGRWTVRGSLTVTGTTRPVELAIERARTDGPRLTAVATAGIDRYAFGVTGLKGLAARRLSCRIEIVAMSEGR